MEFPVRAPKARGFLIGTKVMNKITHSRYLTDEEIAALVIPEDPEEDAEEVTEEVPEEITDEPLEVSAEEKKIPIPKEIMAIVAAARESAKKAIIERPEMPVIVPEVTEEKEPEIPPAAEPEKEPEVPETPAEPEKEPESVNNGKITEEPVISEKVVEEEPFALDDADDELPKKRTRKPAQEKPAKTAPSNDDPDEFGMIQPDFGF